MTKEKHYTALILKNLAVIERDKLRDQLKLQTPKTEKLILDERILAKMDRARKIYGEISAHELPDTLPEEKLKSPHRPLRKINIAPRFPFPGA